MTGVARLFRIEARRNAGMLFLPLLVVVAWFTGDQHWIGKPTLWSETSKQIASGLVFLAPAAGGLAAWMAARGHRRGIEELLVTTPRSPSVRGIVDWGATMIWVLIAYVVAGAYFAFLAIRDATWGGPVYAPIFIGMMAIAAFYALGIAAGTHVRSRFVAPLTAIGLFVGEFVPLTMSSGRTEGAPEPLLDPGVQWLSPWAIVANAHYSVFRELWPEIGLAETVWLIGLTGIGLAVAALRFDQSVINWGAFAAGCGIAIAGAGMLIGAQGSAAEGGTRILYTPNCTTPSGGIEVCVHPAYSAMLESSSGVVNAVLEPLVGIPGVPTRAEQLDRTAPEGTIPIYPDDSTAIVARSIIYSLVWGDFEPALNSSDSIELKNAISLWLLRQAGFGGTVTDELFLINPAIGNAADRFSALTVLEQRAWLETHWTDLSAGKLTLADLP